MKIAEHCSRESHDADAVFRPMRLPINPRNGEGSWLLISAIESASLVKLGGWTAFRVVYIERAVNSMGPYHLWVMYGMKTDDEGWDKARDTARDAELDAHAKTLSATSFRKATWKCHACGEYFDGREKCPHCGAKNHNPLGNRRCRQCDTQLDPADGSCPRCRR